MGFLDKRRKKDIFSFDEKEKQFKAELNGITFVCEEVREGYEQYAEDLANNYENKLSDIIDYIIPDITDMFGVSDVQTIKESLGKAIIDLDNGRLTYLEQTLDDIHIIDIEFDGVFEIFFCADIDG